jgi:hypothetical protein
MRLRIEYRAEDIENDVHWKPENFHVWLNGMELDLVSEVQLRIVNTESESPVCSIVFTPDEIDIDADTITALRALLENAEAAPDEDLATQ